MQDLRQQKSCKRRYRDVHRNPCLPRVWDALVAYHLAKEGYRAWAVGTCLSRTCKNVDLAYEWFNFWLEGHAGAEQSKIGFFSPVDTYEKYLTPQQVKDWYGGGTREGGSIDERVQRVSVWNTRPTNQEYYTEKWNEFLAS